MFSENGHEYSFVIKCDQDSNFKSENIDEFDEILFLENEDQNKQGDFLERIQFNSEKTFIFDP